MARSNATVETQDDEGERLQIAGGSFCSRPFLPACRLHDFSRKGERRRSACTGDPELEEGPVFKQSKFRVYVVYRPQVQYRDFNGILDIHPDGARIVRKFWKERFNALTRPGHYGEFFLEFFDCMSSFAQAYPVETREKERMLDSLEKSFHAFCMALKIDDQFVAFQKKQQELYGD